MEHKAISIRPFIGAKDFDLSRNFYRDLGFQELSLTSNMCLFKSGALGFYLQDAYVQDWIDNTMVFMEVENLDEFYNKLVSLNLTIKYKDARLIPIKEEYWGRECFLHDPSGVLWHFGEFLNEK